MIGYLASYAYFAKSDIQQLKSRVRSPLFADSGAFSVASRGDVITIEQYAKWLWRHLDLWDIYVNLDVIGDVKASAANLKKLQGYGLNPAPVVHFGASKDVMKRIVDENPSYVALGGIAFKKHKEESKRWLDSMFATIPDSIDVHGFGFTRMDGMFDYPWRSVDSSSHLAGARYNSIRLFDGSNLVTVNFKDINQRKKYAHLIEEHNGDVEKFITGKWHYRDVMGLGGVATYRIAKHWTDVCRARGWKEPRIYLAASDQRAHTVCSQAIAAYRKEWE